MRISRIIAGRVAAWLTMVLLVAACGAATTPSPSPSPSPGPTASPSPSPVPDVAGAFLRKMMKPAGAKATIGGRLVVSGLELPVSGEMRFNGSGSHTTLTMSIAGEEQTFEQISLATESWKRTLPGPWLLEPTPPDSTQSLVQIFKTLSGMEDLGVETRDGRDLHRLRPKTGAELPPEAFGFTDPAMKDIEFVLEFLVEEDGTPVVMAISGEWTQDVGGVELSASMELEFTFHAWGGALSIVAPDDVWTVYTSKALGYSMAHPTRTSLSRSAGSRPSA